MLRATFVQLDGMRRTVEVCPGENLFSVALRHEVHGLDGICGGRGACGTCHVYVDGDGVPRLSAKTPEEDMTLYHTALDEAPNSRLCCGLTVLPGTGDLILTVAPQLNLRERRRANGGVPAR